MKNIIISILVVLCLIQFSARKDANFGSEAFDCKGQECYVQVKVNREIDGIKFQDAIYYPAGEWNEKTAENLEAEVTKRFDDWKTLVEEQSSIEEPIIE